MPPAFTFLKNLTSHHPKTPNPNLQIVAHTVPDQDDKSPKKLRRKSKKSTNGHVPPPATRPMDAFGGILGHEVDDIGPSRYPTHPFQSAAGSSHLHPNDAFSNAANAGFQSSDISRPRSKEPPIMLNHSQYDAMQRRNHESNDFHTSTPHPLEQGWREANVPNSFVTPDESPVVSRYMSNGHQYAQVAPEAPPPPFRSWSPIPSVHREDSRDEASHNHEREGVGDQSWITDGNLGNRFSASVTDPRISTMADLGQPDSTSIHTIHYVEYPEEKGTYGATVPRSLPEHWEAHVPNIQPNENEARRQPSVSYLQPTLQPPLPPSTLPRTRTVQPETVQPAMFEQQYWDDEDSEPEIYHYIVPAGVKVVFQDQEGNLITRVGKDGTVEDLSRSSKSAPIVVHDEFGRELYRSKHIRGPSPTQRELHEGHFRTHVRSTYEEHNVNLRGEEAGGMRDGGRHLRPPPWISQPSSISSKSTKTIMIDEKGNQIALKSPSLHRDGGRRLENHDVSYQAQVSYV